MAQSLNPVNMKGELRGAEAPPRRHQSSISCRALRNTAQEPMFDHQPAMVAGRTILTASFAGSSKQMHRDLPCNRLQTTCKSSHDTP